MGILHTGILGTVTQKVANVVCQKWKGLNTVRELVIPKNPKTPKQVFQRDRFSFIVKIARMINDTIITVFWKLYATVSTTEWNEFSGDNIKLQPEFSVPETLFSPDYSKLLLTKGTLEGSVIGGTKTYNSTSGQVVVDFSDAILGNGLDTDKAVLIVIDEEHDYYYLSSLTLNVRSNPPITFNIAAGLTVAKLHAYLFFYRGEGEALEVSDSIYTALIAA